MTPTMEYLEACGVSQAAAAQFANPLISACSRFGILSRMQVACFVAQAMHESANFTQLSENLNYSADRLMIVWPTRFPTMAVAKQYERNPRKLANYVYGNRLGNKGSETDDGWDFRGSGIFQITGHDNFSRATASIGVNYLLAPELLRTSPTDAALSAAWFWYDRGCNNLLQAVGVDAVSQKINGGKVGLKERRDLYNHCLSVA